MKKEEEKKYVHNGKAVTIIPMKKVKKAETKADTANKRNLTESVKGQAKFAVGDKVSVKPAAIQQAGTDFGHSVVIKVFKSAHDQQFRYSVRSASGQELALIEESQLKPRR